MEELTNLVKRIHEDKELMAELIDKFNPLINKYIRILYRYDAEDVRAEMELALWEAVIKMKFVNSEGECVQFFSRALNNKFYELYRKSKMEREYENACYYENIEKESENRIDTINFDFDISNFISRTNEKKKALYEKILRFNMTDIEISREMQLSRQYINRIRRLMYKELKEYFYNIYY